MILTILIIFTTTIVTSLLPSTSGAPVSESIHSGGCFPRTWFENRIIWTHICDAWFCKPIITLLYFPRTWFENWIIWTHICEWQIVMHGFVNAFDTNTWYRSYYTIVPLTPKRKSFPNSHALTDWLTRTLAEMLPNSCKSISWIYSHLRSMPCFTSGVNSVHKQFYK